MSTKQQRFTEYIEAVDSYIRHQMVKRTQADKAAFRQHQIELYNDRLEQYSEELQRAITRELERR